MMRRRDVLGVPAAALLAVPVLRAVAAAAAEADAAPFDFAALKGRARALAAQPYVAQPETATAAVRALNWDQYQRLRFRPERALWADAGLPFRIQMFHLGLNYRRPVRIHVIEHGAVRELAFDPDLFDYADSGLDPSTLPRDLGFAGFRLHTAADWRRDVTVFLGASYFRAVGAEMQYGLSARGLAVDCGLQRPEEFPDFTAFWIERPAPHAKTVTVYALLDSPSVAGAYRFDITPGAVQTMRIDAALYPRRAIERLGLAPLTSMFLNAPYDRRVDDDWRPRIHDSDGLALQTGRGERLWRPLANPAAVRVNAYQGANPRGFGLLQRDRAFDHYQDDGAFYDRRPSLWVEPIAGFGNGAIDLVEIPTRDETADNIVAFWQPATATQPGQELLFAYRLAWGGMPTAALPELARTVASWSGIGGVVGRQRTHFAWRFVLDFAGGELASLPADSGVEAIVSASHGRTELVSARPLAPIRGYRAMFDIDPQGTREPIDLRLYLRRGERALSETWTFQWTPPAPAG